MQPIQNLQTFRNGGMNFDDSPEYIALQDFIIAWNSRNSGTHVSEAGNVTNPESTTEVPGERSTGINKGIGGGSFPDVRQLVLFIYNSGGFHQLAIYDYTTDIQQIIYTDKTDSDGIPLLTLDPQHYVNCVLINGTYLVWADGVSEVGYTNLQTLTSGSYGTVLAEDLSLIKPQNLIPIRGDYANDAGKASNFIKGKLFQFTSQYVNSDFNYSTWGTWSKRIIPLQESTPTEGTDVSTNNCIVVSVDIGSIRATQLNIACRYSLFDFNIIKTVDRSYIVALPNTVVDIANQIFEGYDPTTNLYSFVFYNESLNIPVAPTETDQFVDYIPRAATGIEKINGNIIALGDLTVGYDRPTTSVTLNVSGYDPNLTVPTDPSTDPLRIWEVYGDRPAADHRTFISLSYAGIPHTGDIFRIVLYNNGDVTQTWTYEYTVLASQDGNIVDAVQAFAATLDGGNVVDISGANTILKLTFLGPAFSNLQSASVTNFNAGATVSKSIHALLDNSSYQLALSYRDRWARPFPLETGNNFLVSTPSFAQLNGLTPSIGWNINDLIAPVGAVDYQWLITKNTTVLNLLDVMGNLLDFKGSWNSFSNTPTLAVNVGTVGDTYQITAPNDQSDTAHLVNLGNGTQNFRTGDYVSYNGKSWDIIPKSFADLTNTSNVLAIKINPLNLFNQRYTNNGVDTILNYDFVPGDRCTIHYVIDGSTKVYQNTPCIDVDVFGYDPTTFLVKVQKSSSFDPDDFIGKDIFLRLYSPNTQQAGSETTTNNTTVWYEIGERFTITNGNHDALSGILTDGDVYFKTRSYNGAVDPDTVYDILATDFNFSDFYVSNFTSYGRPRTYYDVLENTEQKATIITSQNYVLGSKRNGLNRFYTESQYGESDGQTSSSYGAIQILWQRGDMLEVFQQLRLGSIPVNRSILEDAIQQQQYAISEKLLNNIRYSQTASVGIGLAKESFCFKDNNAYFVDPNRSEPFRYGLDGIQSISGKMSKYFKATLQLAYGQGRKIIQYYNMFYDEVMLCIQTEGGVLTMFPFSTENWEIFDNYTIVPGDITTVNNGAHCTAVNNMDGTVTYTPTTDYIGNDSASFIFDVDGTPITKNNCLSWVAGDTEVNPFSFTPLIGQALNTLILSNIISVGGINLPVPISITGGQYSINGGSFTGSAGTVVNGDLVQVRLTSANTLNTLTTATLTISTTSAPFNVTTKVAVVINYSVTQQANRFASANLIIKQNGATVVTQNGTGSGMVNVVEGDTIQTNAFSLLDSTGDTSTLTLTDKKDGVTFHTDNIEDNEGASLLDTFVVAAGSVYNSTSVGVATGTSGYTIVNKSGDDITYNIYDGSLVLTSTGTLNDDDVINIQTLITGGANSSIEFIAFATGTYNFKDAPSGTGSTAGAITIGNPFLDYTVADISTEVGLGNVGRIINFVP